MEQQNAFLMVLQVVTYTFAITASITLVGMVIGNILIKRYGINTDTTDKLQRLLDANKPN